MLVAWVEKLSEMKKNVEKHNRRFSICFEVAKISLNYKTYIFEFE